MTEKPCVQLLFPMGGLGTRFAKVGIATPKPLIEVDGMPMISKAVSSFRRLFSAATIRPIFVVRTEHEAEHGLATKLREAVPGAEFAMLDHDTAGATETCLVAKGLIAAEHPIVVMDCDLYFQSAAYEAQLLRMKEDHVAGLLLFFQSKNPRYSYAELAEGTSDVVRTAEKVVISDHALIGAYGFGTGAVFIQAAEKLMQCPLNPATGMKEYYLSLLYNFLLQDGLKVRAVPRDDYASFGTPEELELFRAGKPSYMTE